MEDQQLHNRDNSCLQKSTSEHKFVIFDLDGTLIDSFECVLRCVNNTLDYYSLPQIDILPRNSYSDIANIFTKASTIINGKIPLSEFKKHFDNVHLIDCIDSITIRSFAHNELTNQYNNGHDIVILTNKYQPIAEKICRQFYNGFSLIVIGRRDVNDFKSKLSKIIKALRSYNKDVDDCLCYYGDSKLDADIAESLRVPFVLV